MKNWGTDSNNATADCDNRFGHSSAGFDCFKKWCTGAQPVAHRGWLPAVKATDKALRAWSDGYSHFASGLASNIKDPVAHQWILVDEQYWLRLNYTLLLGSAQGWVSTMALGKGICFDQATDAPAETKDGNAASAHSCTDLIGGTSFAVDLEVVSPILPLEVQRCYLSGRPYWGPWGFNWDHNWNVYLRELTDDGEDVLVVLPELILRGWRRLLHNQRALYVKRLLLVEPNVILASVPYQLIR